MSQLIRISIILKLYNQIFVYHYYSCVPCTISYDRFFSGKYKFFGKLDNIIYQLQETQILINLRIFYSNYNTLLIY